MVIRVDDCGRSYIVDEGLTDHAARELVRIMPQHHKQSYFIQEYTDEIKTGLLSLYGQPGGL